MKCSERVRHIVFLGTSESHFLFRMLNKRRDDCGIMVHDKERNDKKCVQVKIEDEQLVPKEEKTERSNRRIEKLEDRVSELEDEASELKKTVSELKCGSKLVIRVAVFGMRTASLFLGEGRANKTVCVFARPKVAGVGEGSNEKHQCKSLVVG